MKDISSMLVNSFEVLTKSHIDNNYDSVLNEGESGVARYIQNKYNISLSEYYLKGLYAHCIAYVTNYRQARLLYNDVISKLSASKE
jgi:hypothetical protein